MEINIRLGMENHPPESMLKDPLTGLIELISSGRIAARFYLLCLGLLSMLVVAATAGPLLASYKCGSDRPLPWSPPSLA